MLQRIINETPNHRYLNAPQQNTATKILIEAENGKLLTRDYKSYWTRIAVDENEMNEWVEVEEEPSTTYTAEQLAEMTTTELKAICTELGIATSMVKQNMIDLILSKQGGKT